jgi:hypothetical protein
LAEPIQFANIDEKAAFLRRMRLLLEDKAELASSIGVPLTLWRRADDQALIAALNQNPAFSNTILSALQTTTFAGAGRIRDSSRRAGPFPIHLKSMAIFEFESCPFCSDV